MATFLASSLRRFSSLLETERRVMERSRAESAAAFTARIPPGCVVLLSSAGGKRDFTV